MTSSVLASRSSVAANGRLTEIILTSTRQVKKQLEAYLVTDVQNDLWTDEAADIEMYAGQVTHERLSRPTCVDAIMIHSRGTDANPPCDACAAKPDRGPFLTCRQYTRAFRECCSNCKWRDKGVRCSLWQKWDSEDEGEEHDQELGRCMDTLDVERVESSGDDGEAQAIEVVEISSDEEGAGARVVVEISDE